MMPRPLLFAWQWQLIELAPVLIIAVLGLLPCCGSGALAGFYASAVQLGKTRFAVQ
jgi:hypothetical protein